MRYIQLDNIDDIYDIIIDYSSLDRPYAYTVRKVQNNIYHTVESDEYIAFNTQSKDYITAYTSNESDIIKINNCYFIKWRSNYHTNMYVVGSKTNRKYELICSGNLNDRIPFTPTENETCFKINSMNLKLEKNENDFIFRPDNINKNIYSRHEFKTQGFLYNIFSLNPQNRINEIKLTN